MPPRIRIMTGVALVLLGVVAAYAQAPAPPDKTAKAEALSEAARKGDAPAVKKLLDDGVDVNTKYRYGVTALSYACDRGHLEVVKLLLDRGANVNVKDTFYGATPLTWAASPAMGRKPQHAEIVGLLLKHGAQGKEDALMSAVSAPDAAMTKVILDVGGLSENSLSDALESAKKDKHEDIAAMLEQAGAKPHVELKLDATQLARYAGTYSNAQGQLTVAVADGRLVLTVPNGPKFTLVARDETSFGTVEQARMTLTFRLDNNKAMAFTIGNSGTYTRVEGK